MQALIDRLCPAVATEMLKIQVAYRRSVDAVRRCTEAGHRTFLSAILDELPMAIDYGGAVLDLVIHPHSWCTNHCLYIRVLDLDGDFPQRGRALASIEMLLYRLISNIVKDTIFIAACGASLAYRSVSLKTAWA